MANVVRRLCGRPNVVGNKFGGRSRLCDRDNITTVGLANQRSKRCRCALGRERDCSLWTYPSITCVALDLEGDDGYLYNRHVCSAVSPEFDTTLLQTWPPNSIDCLEALLNLASVVIGTFGHRSGHACRLSDQ
ncbi:hypothetical protein Bbelb_009990 [Branchiostoma belcheri]|nr:hypothetical protein Bbelb_009990 [Branchiostoma belcheri]